MPGTTAPSLPYTSSPGNSSSQDKCMEGAGQIEPSPLKGQGDRLVPVPLPLAPSSSPGALSVIIPIIASASVSRAVILLVAAWLAVIAALIATEPSARTPVIALVALEISLRIPRLLGRSFLTRLHLNRHDIGGFRLLIGLCIDGDHAVMIGSASEDARQRITGLRHFDLVVGKRSFRRFSDRPPVGPVFGALHPVFHPVVVIGPTQLDGAGFPV